MRAPNPVRSVSQLPQQFATRPVPQLPPQFQIGGQAPGQPEAQEQMQDLALEIYARLVSRACEASYTSPLEPQHLERLANDARAAALAYFSSMGIRFDGQ